MIRLMKIASFEKQAGFYACCFRAPRVATYGQLLDDLDARRLISTNAEADLVVEVEASAARMEARSEVVILATSIVLAAALAFLAANKGVGWLELVAVFCSLASLYLSLFARLAYAGRKTLGLRPTLGLSPTLGWSPTLAVEPRDPKLDLLARRLAKKQALSAHGVFLLYPASVALVLSVLLT